MARIDCTKTNCETFRQLIEKLNTEGFDIDHFHAVDLIEVDADYSGGEKVVYVLEGDILKKGIEMVVHLNFVFDKNGVVEDAAWSSGNELDERIHPLDQDPRGWFKLVADEWHER